MLSGRQQHLWWHLASNTTKIGIINAVQTHTGRDTHSSYYNDAWYACTMYVRTQNMQCDWQIDGQMDRQTDGWTDGWMDRRTGRQTHRQFIIGGSLIICLTSCSAIHLMSWWLLYSTQPKSLHYVSGDNIEPDSLQQQAGQGAPHTLNTLQHIIMCSV